MSFPTDNAVSVCLVADTGTKLGCSRFAQSHTIMNVPNVLSESLRNMSVSVAAERVSNLPMACRAAIFTKLKTRFHVLFVDFRHCPPVCGNRLSPFFVSECPNLLTYRANIFPSQIHTCDNA